MRESSGALYSSSMNESIQPGEMSGSLVAPEWERLDPRFVTMERRAGAAWSAGMAAFWLAVLVAVALLAPLPQERRIPLFILWAVLAVTHAVWYQYKPILTYRHSSFRVDSDRIEIRRGAFFRRIISVPRSRVQHTDVSQGPFERHHELGTLQIYTAGVSHAHVPLAGLAHARAIAIRDVLLPRERVARS